MNGDLSHGLAPLATSGSRIINAETGAPVLLRGVNRSGLEYSEPDTDGFVSAAGMSGYEFRVLAREWGANIVRLPLNQDWALNGRRGHPFETYLRDIDRVIAWAASNGMYVLLDLQWLDADRPFGPDRQFVPPLPNHQSVDFWRLLAARYRSEPAVLFDVLNEPHDRVMGDDSPLPHHDGGFYPASQRRVTMNEWQPWARKLVDAVRGEHPTSLVFVSGVDWGYDLRGFPLDRGNLVYSTHVYAKKGNQWASAFGDLARDYPVFAAEWGGESPDLEWGARLADYFEHLGMGWCCWGWPDWPQVMFRYTPTEFGLLVRDRLGHGE